MQVGGKIGSGGEGAVYSLQGRPDSVAKIYHKPPDSDHAAKLRAMAGMAGESLFRVAAWPSGTLHDSSGAVVGFVMPRIAGHRPVFQLYGPKLRLKEFPTADWRFLIHVAENAARAFATVHSAGLVIGDVNHGNLVVAEDGTVRLIDCDSFQVSQSGRTWPCLVGVGTHQPPEMQNVTSYAKIFRTPNLDNFGLAVIIFQLLCMARHPFAGRYLGKGQPPSIEEAIAQSRYAYSGERHRTELAPPPGSLPIDALTPRLQNLFETAFKPAAVRGGRPPPQQWIEALRELRTELRVCLGNQAHYYHRQVSACPWCAIEAASGAPLFPAIFVTPSGGAGGMVALWQQVSQIAEPQPLPPPPDPGTLKAIPSPPALAAGQRERRLRAAAYTALLMTVGAVFVLTPSSLRLPILAGLVFLTYLAVKHGSTARSSEFQKRRDELSQEWAQLRATWLAPSPQPTFSQLRNMLAASKARHDALPSERARRLQELSNQIRQRQLQEHLDQFPIGSAQVPGVGRAKIATLSAYGIDTAWDVVEFSNHCHTRLRARDSSQTTGLAKPARTEVRIRSDPGCCEIRCRQG